MMERFRGLFTAIFTPIARLLLKLGVSPDAVTITGTIATSAAALWFMPRGHVVIAAALVTVFALFDLLDGTMARMSGRQSAFGGFLDATLDRIADGAVFASVVLYFDGPVPSRLGVALGLACLVMGGVTSYARARAEAQGFTAKVGIAERTDRLVLLGAAGLLSVAFDNPDILVGGLGLLALASTITVVQRMFAVRRQADAAS